MDHPLFYYESRIIESMTEIKKHLVGGSSEEFSRLSQDIDNYRQMFRNHIEKLYQGA